MHGIQPILQHLVEIHLPLSPLPRLHHLLRMRLLLPPLRIPVIGNGHLPLLSLLLRLALRRLLLSRLLHHTALRRLRLRALTLRVPDQRSEADDLVQDHLPHLSHVLDDFEGEVECDGAVGFVRGVVPDVQVAVLKGGFDADAGGRVEGEHLVEEVESVWVGLVEESLEGDFIGVG